MSAKIGPREAALREAREQRAEQAEKDDGIPAFLRREKGQPPPYAVPPRAAPAPSSIAPVEAAAPKSERPFDPYAAERQATQKVKARGRVAKMLAKKTGATAAMPLTGKAAIAAINAAAEQTAPDSAATTRDSASTQESEVATKSKKKMKSKARAGARTKVQGATRARKGNGESKTDQIAALLKRPSGCTREDILKVTGWPSVSVPAMAKAAGLKLKKDKQPGERIRYYAA